MQKYFFYVYKLLKHYYFNVFCVFVFFFFFLKDLQEQIFLQDICLSECFWN